MWDIFVGQTGDGRVMFGNIFSVGKRLGTC